MIDKVGWFSDWRQRDAVDSVSLLPARRLFVRMAAFLADDGRRVLAMVNPRSQSLTDLEELTLRIPDLGERQYFAEAVQCYFTGAMRASVILAWIVATDNLLGKLEKLAREDGVASDRLKKVKAQKDKEDSFEQQLIDAFGPSALEVLSARDIEQLKHVRSVRNWCAHASGFVPSAEQARSCLRVLVDTCLSTQAYRGKSVLDRIVRNLQDKDYLPPSSFHLIVREVLGSTIPSWYPRLAQRLVEAIASGENAIVSLNAYRFLGAMLAESSDPRQKQQIVAEIAPLAQSKTQWACDILAYDHTALVYLDFQSKERMTRHLIGVKKASDTQDALLQALADTQMATQAGYESIVSLARTAPGRLVKTIQKYAAQLREPVFESICPDIEYDGINNFDRNNYATSALLDIGLDFFDPVTDSQKRRLVKAIVRAAAIATSGKPTVLLSEAATTIPAQWLDMVVDELVLALADKDARVWQATMVSGPLLALVKLSKPIPASWDDAFQLSSDWRTGPHWFTDDLLDLHNALTPVQNELKRHGNKCESLSRLLSAISDMSPS